MCDVKKYYDMYNDMRELQPEDTMQLIMEAKDDGERRFFSMIGDYLLQEKQKEVIARNLF